MTQKKILLLSVSAGAGHMRAGDAICAYANNHDLNAVAIHLDVMDFVTSGFRKLYSDFYLTLVNKAPNLWGFLYQITNEAQPDSSMQRLRRGIEQLNTMALLKKIRALNPDAIVCTHFFPTEILSRVIGKGGLVCPVWAGPDRFWMDC